MKGLVRSSGRGRVDSSGGGGGGSGSGLKSDFCGSLRTSGDVDGSLRRGCDSKSGSLHRGAGGVSGGSSSLRDEGSDEVPPVRNGSDSGSTSGGGVSVTIGGGGDGTVGYNNIIATRQGRASKCTSTYEPTRCIELPATLMLL